MPSDTNTDSEKKDIYPEGMACNDEDAEEYCDPEQRYYSDFEASGESPFFTIVADIFAKEAMVEQPAIEPRRGVGKECRREEQKRGCGE